MTARPLPYLSEAKLRELRESIRANIDRYVESGFRDLERDNGWSIEASHVSVDVAVLEALDGRSRGAEADVKNSLLVHQALRGMTPALAREERVWARLSHIEALEYSRARWLRGSTGEGLEKAIARHMFAPGLTGVRDDNALSRLWWNAHIASLADPGDPAGALALIGKSADIRMQFVERPGSAARPAVARSVLRAMRRDKWVTSTEAAFRRLMIALNRDGGGVLFEVLTEGEQDGILDACIARAAKMGDRST